MTDADRFELENGSPVAHFTVFQAMADAYSGDGYLDAGDLKVTAGTNANAYDVAATSRGLWFGGSVYTYAGGTNVASSSANTSGSPRWDLVYFDVSTTSVGVREGTAATKPDAPETNAGEYPLALVYLADGQSDVTDSEIYNIRLPGGAAEDTWVEDTAGLYANPTVEAALQNELQYAAQLTGYPVPNSDILNSSLTVNAGTGLSTTNAAIGLGGSATLSITSGGVTSTEIASDAAGVDEVNVPEVVVDAPNGHIQTVLLEATESSEISVPVPDTETLKVYRWGGYKIADGTAPTGLDVQLLDDADTVQASANTPNSENTTTPVASYQNTSGTLSIFKLAVNNGTGSALTTDGVGAVFGYLTE